MELVRILILIILSFLLLTTKLGLRFYIALLVLTDVIQVPVNVNVLQGGRELYVTRPVLLYTAKIVPSPYFMFNCFTCSYRCDPGTGKCKCSSGWTGTLCNETCPAPYYGDGCTKICYCKNGGLCNHKTGVCQCPAGYTGP